ncbi:MAG TPA: dihydrodipicolinate synthase family protein [Bryobacteraceae bacterium]|nr:dihydrodipicolinate synthase family protein [Bryobacteraceae bacterium]
MPYSLTKFRGIFPAALTMFDHDNNLDEKATARHWDWLIRQGIDGLVIAGTSGEFIALENPERLRLFRLAREVAAGRVPLIYGSGHYSTKLTIELSVAAERAGADAIIVILPYYQKPSKAAVIRHFREIRWAVNLPVMLYNNPANSACVDLNPREVAQLVEEDVLHMVKSTYETVVPVHDLSYLAGDRMAIFYGSFQAALEAFAAGAHGWISGILNVAPRAARAMYEACLKNDVARGFRIWKRILPLVHLYTHQQIGPVSDLATYRSILNFWGLEGGYSRNPFYPLDEAQERELRRRLEAANWMDPEHALDGIDDEP